MAAATAVACEVDSPTAPSPRFSLTGQVLDASRALPSAEVEVVGSGADQRVTTDADGRYRFPPLVVDDYTVRASAPGYQPQTMLVRLDRNVTADFRLFRRSDPGPDVLVSVSGVVSDADGGTPIPGADLEVIGGPDTGRTAVTDVDGRFLLARLRPGAITIAVSAPGYRSVAHDLVAGDVDALDLVLARATVADPDRVSLSGVVSGRPSPGVAPVPIAGAVLVVLDGPNARRTGLTDADGRYRLDQLVPGAARLEVAAPEFETSTVRATFETTTTVDIVLARVQTAFTTRGRVVNVLTGAPLANVTITGAGITAGQSDATGAFEVGAGSRSPDPHPIELVRPGVVPRQTRLRVPDVPTELSLVPTSFNLTAFDEMLREPRLRRWRTAPPLIIERQTLELSSVDAVQGTALDEEMSEEELGSLLADLRWALPHLTGDTFRAFGGVTERVTPPDKLSTLLTTGAITVVRVKGLTASTGTWGWARWLFEHDGTVIGGVIMLDLAFDRSASPYRRSLRAHELGHALGYAHVFSAPSVMHPDARREPTRFDRNATRIAFSRQPGNVFPDVEPEPGAPSARLGPPVWSEPRP